MISDVLKSHLESTLNHSITKTVPVSGGDISEAFLIVANNNYFLKCNTSKNALAMFEAEKLGLETIAKTNTIRTPKIFDCDQIDSMAYLLIDYIPIKEPAIKDLQLFAEQLASMHKHTSNSFGFSSDNFIGSLHQSNNVKNEWSQFYVQERLKPQLHTALSKQLLTSSEIPSDSAISKTCDSLFKNVKPALLHGDLWSGNYLISEDGQPYLIDPAVYYGHHEVDIAMSLLFGNFGESFYETYHRINSKTEGFQERIAIYQLYYLLVHLNLFGSSYAHAVKRILRSLF